MNSAIFEGHVRHRRMKPVSHSFNYRLFMMLLDLDELDEVFRGRWLWSAQRWALARFRREDHFGDPTEPLQMSVRHHIEKVTGHRPEGSIRLLTHLRYFGYCFNPVSFFYCYDKDDRQVETIVAEVSNTPWGERHLYVLDGSDAEPESVDAPGKGFWQQSFSPKKAMHVSPFMPMNVENYWRFSLAKEQLSVHMRIDRDTAKIFDATLSLSRKEITGRSLARVLLFYPLITIKVITAIHWQALLLWIKRAPVYQHAPSKPENLEDKSCKPSH